MRLRDPTPDPRRWAHARDLLEEHLRHESGGLPGIALVDRLTRCGFDEGEAMAILREMHARDELRSVGGRWYLRADC